MKTRLTAIKLAPPPIKEKRVVATEVVEWTTEKELNEKADIFGWRHDADEIDGDDIDE